jgi:hypothetical protein
MTRREILQAKKALPSPSFVNEKEKRAPHQNKGKKKREELLLRERV